jgi:hypothetical protein
MWDNAAKAKHESEDSMAKETAEKLKVNDVVNKVLQDSGLSKKKKSEDDIQKAAKSVIKKAKGVQDSIEKIEKKDESDNDSEKDEKKESSPKEPSTK